MTETTRPLHEALADLAANDVAILMVRVCASEHLELTGKEIWPEEHVSMLMTFIERRRDLRDEIAGHPEAPAHPLQVQAALTPKATTG